MREYPRNAVLLDTLKEVHESTEWETPKAAFGVVLPLLWRERFLYDAVLLLQPTRRFVFPMLCAKLFWKGRIIGDAFTSLYDTFVFDRAVAGKWSVKALYYFLTDWVFVHMCDTLLFDTEEHRAYFAATYGLGRRRALTVPVTVDMETMEHIQKKKLPHAKPDEFQVLFCGYFIPLQGVEHIIAAAYILREHPHIRFTLLGGGQTRQEMKELAQSLALPNLTFLHPAPYAEYLAYIKGADLSLGVFGNSGKASRVIPNKVVEAAALGVPLVTGQSAPVARYFTDGVNVFFANMADGEDLAKTILKAYTAKDLHQVGLRGQVVVREHFSKENLCNILKAL